MATYGTAGGDHTEHGLIYACGGVHPLAQTTERTRFLIRSMGAVAGVMSIGQLVACCVTYFEMGGGPYNGGWYGAVFLIIEAISSMFPWTRLVTMSWLICFEQFLLHLQAHPGVVALWRNSYCHYTAGTANV
jgi:hypothetical protein